MSNLPNGGEKVVIKTRGKAPVHHNNYPMPYNFAAPERFGECSPFMHFFGVPDDSKVLLRSVDTLESMSLSDPLLQEIRKNKDYYVCRRSAILPHTWDLIYNNPVKGDDINADLANSILHLKNFVSGGVTYGGLQRLFLYSVNESRLLIPDGDTSKVYPGLRWINVLTFLRTHVLLNGFFAKDSLFAAFQMPLSRLLGDSYDSVMQSILSSNWSFYHTLLQKISIYANQTTFTVRFIDYDGNDVLVRNYDFTDVSARLAFFYDFIENPLIEDFTGLTAANLVLAVSAAYNTVKANPYFTHFWTYDTSESNYVNSLIASGPNADLPINIAPVIAYQLAMFEYQTNDKIDYIYSAKLYRQLWESFAFSHNLQFEYNQYTLPYDGFSMITIASVIDDASFVIRPRHIEALDLLISLIYRKRSLKYADYFTGSRSTPIAVGDVNVDVSGGSASAIDITKSIQMQRFLNQVNRVGRKAKEYLRGVFNADYHTECDCPVKIGHTDETIYNVETQNTGAAQVSLDQSRTVNFKSHSSNFAFETSFDEASIVIGVSSYEIKRFYPYSFDPMARKIDRFDMFNPYMQYIGDQPIKKTELDAAYPDDNFSYTNRHMEYKTRISYFIGDFHDALRGWVFATQDLAVGQVIDPDFIRAHQNELDRYYVALTGTTPTTRYHFICKYTNLISANRNMVFNPQILG